jgi:uncharacterized membrane protein
MAEDDDTVRNDPARGGDGLGSPALEERVARLERELDALRRQITAAMAAEAPPRVDTMAPAPPPPMPLAPEAGVVGAAWTGHGAAGQPPVALAIHTVPPPIRVELARKSPLPESPAPPESFEMRLGSRIFNRIAILVLMIGTALFLKLAVDRAWIVPSPAGRVIVGLLAGAGIVLWSERFRRKGFAPFSYSLKALGSGVLYLSLWAAFHIYHLLPAAAALALMVLVTAWNAWMAWAQDSELLAAYALAGGFATPLLLSTGENHEAFLFSYLLAIDIATVALVRLKAWPRLLLGAFPMTMAFFIAWYVQWYAKSALLLTSVWIVLFDCTFSSVPVRRGAGGEGEAASGLPPPKRADRSTLIEDIFLPLANSVFLAGGLYSVLEDAGHHDLLPWLMILLASVYLAFMRLPQSRTARAIHLSIAVVLLTIAIPLKASGHWITASWLVEGLALLWVATRLTPTAPVGEPSEAYAGNALRLLASGALALGFCGILLHSPFADPEAALQFFNADTGTALTGVAVFAGVAWLALRAAPGGNAPPVEWRQIAVAAYLAIDLIALLLTLRELLGTWSEPSKHPAFRSAYFATALLGLGVFAGVVAFSLRVARERPEEPFWMNCAGLSTVAFNLVAVLTGVRELDSIWERAANLDFAASVDAALQQALAISGFLMLYGAGLLAVGFWRRSAFLRWQALLLLVFTIFKAFLYDIRNLSQGYRVVSFLGLGALLLAISFAYQKDWLSLREAETAKADTKIKPEAAE